MYDVVIIGAGVIGTAAAREIARYKLKICVVEKHSDVNMGTSKANSAIIHAGFDAKVGTLKAKLNVEGNKMMKKLSKDLDFDFDQNGSMVLCFDMGDIDNLKKLYEQGKENGVEGLKILSGDEARSIEPNLSAEVVAVLYAPSGGIVCPFGMNLAFAESAFINGVDFKFNYKVIDIKKENELFILTDGKEEIKGKIVINASGVYSDDLSNILSEKKINVHPRKGEYLLFDKMVGNTVHNTIFQLPTKLGKGVLVTPTIHGNLLVGPNALDIEDKEDLSTTREGLKDIAEKAALSVNKLPMNMVITSFSGLRAVGNSGDFIIEEAQGVPGFINAAGIESPGLTASPAIGKMLKDMVIEKLNPETKDNYQEKRIGIKKFSALDNEEKKRVIDINPKYGNIICRCEMVTEAEIIDAIRRPLGARTLDGVKIRTRAGMGRCQAGFCTPKLVDILSKELNISPLEVTKFGEESYILTGINKENI
ncbi:MAG: NAD(P)/FAD-dependent oxidoreductase [Clostridiaceae bacterium]